MKNILTLMLSIVSLTIAAQTTNSISQNKRVTQVNQVAAPLPDFSFSPQCDIKRYDLNFIGQATLDPNAAMYQYWVRNVQTGAIYTLNKYYTNTANTLGMHEFFTNASGQTVQLNYKSNYEVKARVKYSDGSFSPYGKNCFVSFDDARSRLAPNMVFNYTAVNGGPSYIAQGYHNSITTTFYISGYKYNFYLNGVLYATKTMTPSGYTGTPNNINPLYFNTVTPSLWSYNTNRTYTWSVTTLFFNPNTAQTEWGAESVPCPITFNKITFQANNISYLRQANSEDIKEDKATIDLYPNPTQGIINLVLDEEIKYVKVISLSGQEMKVELQEKQLDLTGLENGFYFVLVETETTFKKFKVSKTN